MPAHPRPPIASRKENTFRYSMWIAGNAWPADPADPVVPSDQYACPDDELTYAPDLRPVSDRPFTVTAFMRGQLRPPSDWDERMAIEDGWTDFDILNREPFAPEMTLSQHEEMRRVLAQARRDVPLWRLAPYRKLVEQDGCRVLVDQWDRAICRKNMNGSIEILPSDTSIDPVEVHDLYGFFTPPVDTPATLKIIPHLIDELQIDGELTRRAWHQFATRENLACPPASSTSKYSS